jgi:repressor LexA
MQRLVTEKQMKVLELIYESTRQEGFPPTMTELRDALGVASNQSVLNFLQALAKHGYIQRGEGRARSITISPLGFKALGKRTLVPLAGESAGGSYIAPVHVSAEWIELPASVAGEKLRRGAAELFAVQVYGDSMLNAGIRDRDIVLVKKSATAHAGDIVLAHTAEGTTVKRFVITSERKKILQPANPSYASLPCTSETIFDGTVIFNLTSGQPLT